MYICEYVHSMYPKIENTASVPFLPPDLANIYSSLPDDMKRLFNKVFSYLWGAVAPARRFVSGGGVLWAFWIVDMLRIKNNLTASELSALSYLYQITNKGSKIVKSETVYNGMVLPDLLQESKTTLLHKLKRKGYIIRLNRDISAPYLQRSIARQRVFIQMTGKAIFLIEEMERDLYHLLLNTSFNTITGVNKRSRSFESVIYRLKKH